MIITTPSNLSAISAFPDVDVIFHNVSTPPTSIESISHNPLAVNLEHHLKSASFFFEIEKMFFKHQEQELDINLASIKKTFSEYYSTDHSFDKRIDIIKKALLKDANYFSRFFSAEPWGEWVENRTALGKVFYLYADYLTSSTPLERFMKRLDSQLVSRACQQADRVLERLQQSRLKNITKQSPSNSKVNLFNLISTTMLFQYKDASFVRNGKFTFIALLSGLPNVNAFSLTPKKHYYCVVEHSDSTPGIIPEHKDCWSYVGGEAGRVGCAIFQGDQAGTVYYGKCSEDKNQKRLGLKDEL